MKGVALLLAVVTYFALGMVTDPIHDALFLSHTSIQDGVEDCNMAIGRYMECEVEDGVRAYESTGWAILGNAFSLLTTLVRFACAYLVYRVLVGSQRK